MQRCRITATLALGIVAALAMSCAEPEPPTDPAFEETPVEDAAPIEVPETDVELRSQLDEVREAVEAAQESLRSAIEASLPSTANESIEAALAAVLTDVGDGEALAEDAQALLPSQTLDRSESSAPDLLSETLSLAQDLGGSLARETVEVLTDTIAGDLGAWQRDPAGMVALARSTAGSSTDVTELEVAVLSLDGEGTRALAWMFVAQESSDPRLIDAAAERGLAHLGIIATSIDDLLEEP